MSKLMTLGEAKVHAKTSFDDARGLEGDEVKLPPHKSRMSYKDACEYYNKKLFRYWITQISDEIEPKKREKALKYLLGIRNQGENNGTNR